MIPHDSRTRETVQRDIAAELERQDAKWGASRILPAGTWVLILAEEFGELSQALLERHDQDDVYAEAIQVAAVAAAIAASVKRGEVVHIPTEEQA